MAEETQTTSSGNYGYGKRPMWQWILLYVVVGGLIYGAYYYFVMAKKGGYNSGESMYTTSPTAVMMKKEETTPSATMKGEPVKVSGNEFAFTPATLSVKLNEPVTVTFTNDGKYPHNFTIADLDVKGKTVNPGQSDSVTFTPSKAGTFEYNCTVDSHTEKGMVGKITVQ